MPAPTNPHDTTVRAAGMLLVCLTPTPQFLLMRHPDRWDLPKGHCDPGETFLETAIRETVEETGIPAEHLRVDERFSWDITYPVRYKRTGDRVFTKTVRYFLAHLDHLPQLTLTEHTGYQWFPWSPPHAIQAQTIDPLLHAVETFWRHNQGTDDTRPTQ